MYTEFRIAIEVMLFPQFHIFQAIFLFIGSGMMRHILLAEKRQQKSMNQYCFWYFHYTYLLCRSKPKRNNNQLEQEDDRFLSLRIICFDKKINTNMAYIPLSTYFMTCLIFGRAAAPNFSIVYSYKTQIFYYCRGTHLFQFYNGDA